ncbi:MAG: S8 family peptidase [Halioglobus sp.]
MRNGPLIAILVLLPLVTGHTPAAAQDEPAQQKLSVMLQGGSATELRELVERHGGEVTHDLPIIDAVGAQLTRSQLDAVILSPLVSRHIDDLSLKEIPPQEPAEPENKCDVDGSLELDIADQSVRWRLYNKKEVPALLEHLTVRWPQRLGPIASISVDSLALDSIDLPSKGAGALEIELSGKHRPGVRGTADLRIQFLEIPGKSGAVQQKDFSIKASFAGDCSTELLPAYENNHEDFYYATAAGADALHANGITGAGITVAVLDSGLWEHQALTQDTAGKNRIIARYDAIGNTAEHGVFDESGHGTHMTSVIAHSGAVTRQGEPTGTFKGIAPDVRLVAVKAFDFEGQGDFLDIVRGVQWVVDNREKYNIRVLNLSFAARPRWHYWLDPINQAIMRAWAAGITVVAAAGNEGPEPMTIGSPGNLPYIITVGAVTDSWTLHTRDDDYIPDFSSRGPTPDAHIKPDIVAPGGHITGITRPGSTLTKEHPEYMLHTGEFVMTGSSQASAVVSGLVALLLQLEPDLTPDEVKCKLISSAEPAINRDGLLAYSPFEQGYGYVNAGRTVTLGQRDCGDQGLDIHRDMEGLEHFQGPAIVAEDGSVSLPGLRSMVSPVPAEKGLSTTRKWGVKAHIERQDGPAEPPDNDPFNWPQIYLEEKARIEKLAQDRPG